MADRKASVTLELKAAQFKAEAAASEESVDGLDRKVEKLDHDINKIPADAAKAAAGLGILGGTAKEVGRDLDDMGKKTGNNADEAGKLKNSIAELEGNLKSLAAEFDRTGDPALLKKFRADSSELAGLKKMSKGFEDIAGDVEHFGKEAASAAESSQGLFSSLKAGFEGGLTSPAVLGMGAAALGPALAAAGGAIGALGGAAGAGLGIYGAVLGNPEAFKSAWSAATSTVKKDLIDAGAAFTGPALDAIKTIGPTISSWHLDQALAPAAKFVPVLVSGLEKAATGFEHGFADLVANAGPEVQALSDGMAQFGQAVGTAFSEIASGSQGGAQALHDTITLVSDLTVAIGGVTGAAETAFGFIHDHPFISAIGSGGLTIPISLWDAIAGSANKASDATAKAGDAAAKAGPDFAALSTELNKTKVDGDSLAETMSLKVLNATMGLDQATLSFKEALLGVDEAVKKNGHSLSDHTMKGLENQKMILGLVQANIAEYQANVNAGMGAEAAAKAYDAGTAALEKQLRQAGFTQSAIDGLIGKYKGVPKNIDTSIAINGLTDAINGLSDLIASLNHINGHNYHSTVTTDYIDNRKSTYSSQVPSYSDVVPHHDPHPHAGGGALDPGWNIVGEQGPELIKDGRVYPASQSRSMMARWGGGGITTVAVSVEAGPNANLTPLGTLINQMLRNGDIVVKASQVRAG